jgi:DNA invertase Pin-like site-specific DNA recombinase
MSDPQPKRAYVYVYTAQIRSPDVKEQVLACRAVAGALGLVIVKTEIDGGRCGPNEAGRDGRARLLEAAEAGKYDTLIIQNCDRLSRNRCDAAGVMAQLAANGIEILTVDNGLVSGLGVPTGFAQSVELAEAKAPEPTTPSASASPKSGG